MENKIFNLGKSESSPPPPQNSVNGALNGSKEQGLNGVERDRNDNKIQQQKSVPSTNMKCLEDPNFSFDEPKSSKCVDTAKPPVESQPAKNKKPSYRVLEDPDIEIPPAPQAGGFKSDPMTTSIYQPKQ